MSGLSARREGRAESRPLRCPAAGSADGGEGSSFNVVKPIRQPRPVRAPCPSPLPLSSHSPPATCHFFPTRRHADQREASLFAL